MQGPHAKKLADVPRWLAVFLRVSGSFAFIFLLGSPLFGESVGALGPRLLWLGHLWFFGMLVSIGLTAVAMPTYLWLGRGRLNAWDRASLRPLFRPFILVWACFLAYVTLASTFAFLSVIYNRH